jgi:LysR family glycine cleavage system transcriptional activator
MVKSWSGVVAEHLLDEVLTPVISAELLRSRKAIGSPQDLLPFGLIHVAYRPNAWRDWFRSQGFAVAAQEGMKVGHFFLALEAAQKKLGVAIAAGFHLNGFPGRRGLVTPFASHVKSAGAFYVLHRKRDLQNRNVRTLRDWLLAQAADTTVGAGERAGISAPAMGRGAALQGRRFPR